MTNPDRWLGRPFLWLFPKGGYGILIAVKIVK